MAKILKDDEIGQLLVEEKPLPADWEGKLRPRVKQNVAFRQCELDVRGVSGKEFRIVVRQATGNMEDFSIILMYKDIDGTEYRLSRFNGRHPSAHTNKVEKREGKSEVSFRDRFHIHSATERYQLAGLAIDGFAEPTTVYNSFSSALRGFLDFYKFTRPEAPMPLFDTPGGSQS